MLVSRAKDGVTIATSDRAGLIDAIRERSGEQQAALDQLEARQAPEIARAAVQEVTQERERQRQQEREQQQQRERALQQQREKSDDPPARASPAVGMPISARSVTLPLPAGSRARLRRRHGLLSKASSVRHTYSAVRATMGQSYRQKTCR